MIAALLLAQASAVDAERAFAADAQRLGQWTAFRKWAAEDAVMFWPQPVKAQDKLKALPDPPESVEWKPARSFVSCDGTMAANTGPWRRPDGSVGYFSTVWAKQPGGGWKWTVDGGDAVKTPRFAWSADPAVRRASCNGKKPVVIDLPVARARSAQGRSSDDTLLWGWVVRSNGARSFHVNLWTGRAYERVIFDEIAAPPAP